MCGSRPLASAFYFYCSDAVFCAVSYVLIPVNAKISILCRYSTTVFFSILSELEMAIDAPEVPATVNKKHLDILKDIPEGWILR
jgi:hypothetical protein